MDFKKIETEGEIVPGSIIRHKRKNTCYTIGQWVAEKQSYSLREMRIMGMPSEYPSNYQATVLIKDLMIDYEIMDE